MSFRYLLDTNIVSEPLRAEPSRRILRNLQRQQHQIAIASIVWHELRFGMEALPASRRRDRIERYLQDVVEATMPILDYDSRAAEWHAAERARLAARGETPPFADGQIAAVAFVNDLTLVTLNDAHFKRFLGLHVVTWR